MNCNIGVGAARAALRAPALHHREGIGLARQRNFVSDHSNLVVPGPRVRYDDNFDVVVMIGVSGVVFRDPVAESVQVDRRGPPAVLPELVAVKHRSVRVRHGKVQVVYERLSCARRPRTVRPRQRDPQRSFVTGSHLKDLGIDFPPAVDRVLFVVEHDLVRLSRHWAVDRAEEIHHAPSVVHRRPRRSHVLVRPRAQLHRGVDQDRLDERRRRRGLQVVRQVLKEQRRGPGRQRRGHRRAAEHRVVRARVQVSVTIVAAPCLEVHNMVKIHVLALDRRDVRAGSDNIRLHAAVGCRPAGTEIADLPVRVGLLRGIGQVVRQAELFHRSHRDDVLRMTR